MKISGPDGPKVVEQAAGEAAEAGEKAQASEFKELLGPEAATSTAASGVDSLEGLQAQLKAGQLDGAGAVAKLVESTVASYAASVGPAMAEAVRQELERLLEQDPVLAQKIKTLTRGG